MFQSETGECGLACLATVASHHGKALGLPLLRQLAGGHSRGLTMATLITVSAGIGLSSRPLRVPLEALDRLRMPCILHWDLSHFVVLLKVSRTLRGERVATIFDPAVGLRRLSLAALSPHFSGMALELWPGESFQRGGQAARPPSVLALLGPVAGAWGAVGQLLFLTLILELLALGSPLFSKFVIDDVIGGHATELLLPLTACFAALLLTQTATSLLRGWLLMRWSQELSLGWMSRILNHLVRLPMRFFDARCSGEVLSRLGSAGTIQSVLTGIALGSLFDVVVLAAAFAMMIGLSPSLSVVVVVPILVYLALKALTFPYFEAAARERLMLASRESQFLLEIVRSMMPIKLFSREADRISRWQNLRQAVQNRDLRTENFTLVYHGGVVLIFGVQGLFIFYFGATSVLAGQMTLGFLMAFSAYAATFGNRLVAVIDAILGFRMLAVHGERLSDILLEAPEPGPATRAPLAPLASLQLQGVGYRYARDGQPVLRDLDLVLAPKQCIGLKGASGAGKSTLARLMLGLVRPTDGVIRLNDVVMDEGMARAWRTQVAAVTQDDTLLAGTLQENIAFFDADVDAARVEWAARMAALHDDIVRMPMGYRTVIGESARTLSGGQRQRLLIARALYKRADVLILDEATSHLDVDTELEIMARIRALPCCVVVITHRPQVLALLETCYELRDGALRPWPAAEPAGPPARALDMPPRPRVPLQAAGC